MTPTSSDGTGYVQVDALAIARERVYAAEVALHTARGSGYDDYVAIAYARLHDALLFESRIGHWLQHRVHTR